MRQYLLVLLVFIATTLLAINPIMDTDLGWHVRVGEFVAQQKHIPTTDFLTFSAQRIPYAYHSWATALLLYFAYTYGGSIGVSLLYGVMYGGIGSMFFLTSRTITSKPSPRWLALIITLSMPLLITSIGLRTQVFGLCMMCIFVYLIITNEKRSDKKNIVLITILFATWANTHGSIILGIGLLGLWLTLQVVLTKKLPYLPAIVAFTTAVSATLINPYGIDLLIQTFTMLTNPTVTQANMDWQPLFAKSAYGFNVHEILLIICSSTIGFPRLKEMKHRPILIIAIILLLFTIMTRRFMLGLLPILLPFVFVQATTLLGRKQHNMFPIYISVIVLSISVLLTSAQHAYLALCAHRSPHCFAFTSSQTTPPIHYPYEAMERLQDVPGIQNIWNPMEWGGYIALFYPEYEYYIDGRMDHLFIDNEPLGDEYLTVIQAKNEWEALFREYGIDAVLTKPEWPLTEAVTVSSEWEQIFKNSSSVLFLKSQKPNKQ